MMKKYAEGPIGVLWVAKSEAPKMPILLGKWFLYSVVISVFTAYITSRTAMKGADFMKVFRIAGTVAFMAYATAGWSDTIWKGKPTSAALKETLDGLIYGLVTAAAFGWLWPGILS
jgi:hypothetical protein